MTQIILWPTHHPTSRILWRTGILAGDIDLPAWVSPVRVWGPKYRSRVLRISCSSTGSLGALWVISIVRLTSEWVRGSESRISISSRLCRSIPRTTRRICACSRKDKALWHYALDEDTLFVTIKLVLGLNFTSLPDMTLAHYFILHLFLGVSVHLIARVLKQRNTYPKNTYAVRSSYCCYRSWPCKLLLYNHSTEWSFFIPLQIWRLSSTFWILTRF